MSKLLTKDARHFFVSPYDTSVVTDGRGIVFARCYEDDAFYRLKLYKHRVCGYVKLPKYLYKKEIAELTEVFDEPSAFLDKMQMMLYDGVWDEHWVKGTPLPIFSTVDEAGEKRLFEKRYCRCLEYPVRKWEEPKGWLKVKGGYTPLYDRSWANIEEW